MSFICVAFLLSKDIQQNNNDVVLQHHEKELLGALRSKMHPTLSSLAIDVYNFIGQVKLQWNRTILADSQLNWLEGRIEAMNHRSHPTIVKPLSNATGQTLKYLMLYEYKCTSMQYKYKYKNISLPSNHSPTLSTFQMYLVKRWNISC